MPLLIETLLTALSSCQLEEKLRQRLKSAGDHYQEVLDLVEENRAQNESLDLVIWTDEDKEEVDLRRSRIERLRTNLKSSLSDLVVYAVAQEIEGALKDLQPPSEPSEQKEGELRSSLELAEEGSRAGVIKVPIAADPRMSDQERQRIANRIAEAENLGTGPPLMELRQVEEIQVEGGTLDKLREQIRQMIPELSTAALLCVGEGLASTADRRFRLGSEQSKALYSAEQAMVRWLEAKGIHAPDQRALRISKPIQLLIERELSGRAEEVAEEAA